MRLIQKCRFQLCFCTVISVVLLALLLFGCGGGSEAPDSTAGAQRSDPLANLSPDKGATREDAERYRRIGPDTAQHIVNTPTFSLPLVAMPSMEVENFDIDISGYDPALFEITDISLSGGALLDGDYVISYNADGDVIRIVIYGRGNLVSIGPGSVLGFLQLRALESGQTALSVTKFESGETPVEGGLGIGDLVYENVDLRVNSAPVLDVSVAFQLAPIGEDEIDNPGTPVADILGAGGVLDEDDPDVVAMAVVMVDNTNGQWQYSLENGAIYENFAEDAETIFIDAAVLLDGEPAGDDTHRIRFVPDSNWNGAAQFTFRAWDKSAGIAGQRTDASVSGGFSSFSDNTDNVTISVIEVNDAPVLDPDRVEDFTAIRQNETDNDGDRVAEILVGSVSDIDGNAAAALGVTSVDNTGGVWRFSTDGGASWQDFTQERGIVVNLGGASRLLEGGHQIRFEPDLDWSGIAGVTFRAWDKSDGTAGGVADPGEGGGQTAFSAAEASAEISVSNVPTANAGPDQNIREGAVVTLNGSGSAGVIASYQWTQAEGPAISLSDPTAVHPSFTAPQVDAGELVLSFQLTVKSEEGLSSSDGVTVTVADVPAPTALFSAEPMQGGVPLTVAFSDESQGDLTGWKWDFGDGIYSVDQHPSHTYSTAGDYTVRLTVTGPGGSDALEKTDYIKVISVPVTADFSVDPTAGIVPLNASFTPKATGEIEEYLWKFGDGRTSSAKSPTHAYQSVGSYNVSLTVKGPGGEATETKTSVIVVEGRQISGQVTGEDDGAGIPGCVVEVWDDAVANGLIADAVTDADGRYAVADLPAASNLLAVAWPPQTVSQGATVYKNRYYDDKSTPAAADRFSTIGGNLTGVDFHLPPVPLEGVKGRVWDGTTGITGIEVNIFSEKAQSGKNVLTDENGDYLAVGLTPSDDYRISVLSAAEGGSAIEFYYAIPENETVGKYVPDASAISENDATFVSPADPPVENIDIIVNPDAGGQIEGTVRAAETNDPLAGVQVHAWSDVLETGNGAETNENGHYLIRGLEPVSETDAPSSGYRVAVQSDQYPYQAYSGAASPDDAQLLPSDATAIDFALKTQGTVSGRVTDISGAAVAGADVSVRSQSDPVVKGGKAVTDGDGNYAVSSLPLGDDYIVGVFALEYPPRYYPDALKKVNAELVSLLEGDAAGVDVVLDKGAVISGRVFLETGDPAPGAAVNVWSAGTRTGGDVVTDTDGAYEVAGLLKDALDYVVSVRLDGYIPAYYGLDGAVFKWKDAARLRPSSAAEVGAIHELPPTSRNVTLASGFAIEGTVSSDDGAMGEVRVRVVSVEDGASFQTVADADGRYSVTNLPPGEYQVIVESVGFEADVQTVNVVDGEITMDFQPTPLPERTIQGTISGLAVGESVQIRAASASTGDVNVVDGVDAMDGENPVSYIISELTPAADYIVELTKSSSSGQTLPLKLYYAVGGLVYGPQSADRVDLTDGDAQGVDFVLPTQTASISGEVVFPADAQTGETARVEVFSETTGAHHFAEVQVVDSQSATYEINGLGEADDWLVAVRSDGYLDHYYAGDDGIGAQSASNALRIDTTGFADAVVDFFLSAGATISGRVLDLDGAGAEGLTVKVWSDDIQFGAQTETGPDGEYAVKGLPKTLDFKAGVEDPERGSFYYAGDSALEGAVTDRSLAEPLDTVNGNPSDVIIRLIEVNEIRGIATDLNGQGLPLVWVEAYSELYGLGKGAFTGEDGRYVVQGLLSGNDFQVSARPDWYTVPTVKTNIASGSQGINFILNPGERYSIEGIVSNDRNVPVPGARVEAWSESLEIEGDAWGVSDASGRYRLEGLPAGNDYILAVWPPDGTPYSYTAKEGVSVPSDGLKNIVLEGGASISGVISFALEEAVGAIHKLPLHETARVVATSNDGSDFTVRGEISPDGAYIIDNLPSNLNYNVAVQGDGFLSRRKLNQPPGGGVDFVLDVTGAISGEVINKATGAPIPNVRVQVVSESRQGMIGVSANGQTDAKGWFSIQGLRPSDEGGRPVDDYIITVFAPGFPPLSKGARRVGDTVNFAVARGPENEIAGDISWPAVAPADGVDYGIDVFGPEGNFIQSATVAAGGDFKLAGLAADGTYLLKFTAYSGDKILLAQWSAKGDDAAFDIGVENPDDPDAPPGEAKIYTTNSTVHFRFGSPPPEGRMAGVTVSSTGLDARAGEAIQINTTTHNEAVSNNPNITVEWTPPAGVDPVGYYYAFNDVPDYVITKRNAPAQLPLTIRNATSRALTGDRVDYYFHVAEVDRRGRIGRTASKRFKIDTIPPQNGMVIGPEKTSERLVRLVMGVTDAKEMYVSNMGYGQAGKWEARIKELDWELTPGDGMKQVYALFRDEAGNIANYQIAIKKVSVAVNNPPVMADQTFVIAENSPAGTFVGIVEAVDPDPDDILTFAIANGDPDGAFVIDPTTGELTVSGATQLDYEMLASYQLTVTASDGVSASETASAVITIDLENLPDEIAQKIWMDETVTNGTQIGVVSAGEMITGTPTFEIVGGDPDGAFAIDPETGVLTVRDAGAIDYATRSEYALTVVVTGDDSTPLTVVATIHVNDISPETTAPSTIQREWMNPKPTGNALHGLWIYSAEGGAAVGDAGTILMRDADGWSSAPSGLETALYGVWAASPTEMFAVGSDGVILKYDGIGWTTMVSSSPEGADLYGVWGASENGPVVAVGEGGAIRWFDGNEWTDMDSPVDAALNSVFGTSATIIAVGQAGTILRFDGAEWRVEDAPHPPSPLKGEISLSSVWGTGETFFAVGDDGTILRFNGNAWTAMAVDSTANLKGVWGTGPSDVFAVGTEGTVLHYDGNGWSKLPFDGGDWLYAVSGSPETGAVMAGANGALSHFKAGQWQTVSAGFPDNIKDVWGRAPDDVFAVGGRYLYDQFAYAGTVLHFNGATWERMTGEADQWLYAIRGPLNATSSDGLFAAGWGGAILRRDGDQWRMADTGTDVPLYGLWLSEDGLSGFAAGDEGAILRFDGNEWTWMETPTTETLYDLWGPPSLDQEHPWTMIAVGEAGTILGFDGETWKILTSGVDANLYSVWGCETSDGGGDGWSVLAVGDQGTILRHDGETWRSERGGKSEWLRAVWMDETAGWTVGDDGLVLRFDGNGWTKISSGTTRHLKAVYGMPEAVFIAGDAGTILRFSRNQ